MAVKEGRRLSEDKRLPSASDPLSQHPNLRVITSQAAYALTDIVITFTIDNEDKVEMGSKFTESVSVVVFAPHTAE